jgi:hypothetical protein
LICFELEVAEAAAGQASRQAASASGASREAMGLMAWISFC